MSRRIARVATKKERQRQLAKQAHERRMQRRDQQARRARQWSVSIIVAVLVVGVGVAASAIGGVFSSAKSTASAKTSPPAASSTPATSSTASPPASATPSPTSTAAMVDGKCAYTKSGTAAKKVSLPPAKPDTKASYTAKFTTSLGTISVKLASAAPCTVNSFVSLADQSYFNNTHCHRLVTSGIYVLQCGDPLGTGQGGPGYVFNTENTSSLKQVTASGQQVGVYPAGSVAMANTGQPDSNGSQFFFVYKNTDLPASYTPFGTITSGLSIIQKVAKAGSDNSNGTGDGHPKEKVQIDSVTITKT
ncbi:MAG TPA: peptidylprolyl isomerase [Streptosporangiaceae bacterium]|nr:peptidylprolyl isomerase [Streptosporangiaceae bacterium]